MRELRTMLRDPEFLQGFALGGLIGSLGFLFGLFMGKML